jgi:hypothetical protein
MTFMTVTLPADFKPIEPPIDPHEIPVVAIGEKGWAEFVLNQIAFDEPVIIVGDGIWGGFLCIKPADLHPRRPIWAEVRRLLKEAGARVPRVRWQP